MSKAEPGTTLYLRGIPRSVVRESKARAAHLGVTLTAYVTELLEHATDDEPVAGAGPLDEDLAWYRARRDDLAAEYDGEYVAVVDRQVVDHDPTFDALARRVRERFGDRPMLMPKCIAGDRVVNVPSPRVRR